jgi:hypothetical protein
LIDRRAGDREVIDSDRSRGGAQKQRRIVIVAARCGGATAGAFGIRFERSGESLWSASWAFALKENVARREGYDRTEIRGMIALDPSYPGCPHCAKRALVCCGSCGKVSCWDGETQIITCPWCGNRAELAGAITALESRKDA